MKSLWTPEDRALRAAIRRARKSAELTQVEVGKRVGRTQGWVSKLEKSDPRIDVIEFVELMIAIGADPGQVLEPVTESVKRAMPRRRVRRRA